MPCLVFVRASFLQNPKPENLGKLSWNAPYIYAKNEHVGIIECPIFTIKERARAKCHAISFKIYKVLMTRSLIEGVVDLLNRFPSKYGVSGTLSSSTILEGRPKLDMEQKKTDFSSYTMVHNGTTNTMKKYVSRILY